MSFAFNDGVSIRYEVECDGDSMVEPVVMVDGFSTSLGMWRDQGYVEHLAPSHQLILVDARGHGQSDKPHDPAQYQPELMAADVVAVLDHLGVQKAHYIGASMGAAIGLEVAIRAPGRLRSLILMGYGRYGPPTEAQRQFQALGRRLQEIAVASGAEATLAAMEQLAGPRSPEDRSRFLASFLGNDQRALLAFLEAFEEWPGLEDVLPQVTVPSLFLVVEGDPFYPSARKCAEVMPHATFVALARGVHSQNSYGPETVVPHIREFLEEAGGR